MDVKGFAQALALSRGAVVQAEAGIKSYVFSRCTLQLLNSTLTIFWLPKNFSIDACHLVGADYQAVREVCVATASAFSSASRETSA